MNYNGSQVGVPYVRASKITIHYPDAGQPPVVVIEQAEAVKLADGVVREFAKLPPVQATLDLANAAQTTYPLINPETDAPLGADTTLQTVYLNVLAAVRAIQKSQE